MRGHERRGFTLCSQRSSIRSRYYLQVPLTDDIEPWTDDAFWQEMRLRLDDEARERLVTGPAMRLTSCRRRGPRG